MREFAMILFLIFGAFIAIGIYLIPSIIAVKSNHPNKGAIIALNILAGWTFIVWVVSLVWALTKSQEKTPVYFVQNGRVVSDQPPENVVKERSSKPVQSQQKNIPNIANSEQHNNVPDNENFQESRPIPVPFSQKDTLPLRPHINQDAWPDKNIPQHYSSVKKSNPVGSPKLVGISGQYAGQKVDLDFGKVSIGRDPSLANLIYPHSFKDISRKHCTVSYDKNIKSFYLEDSSTNGTFIFPQNRLQQGHSVQIDNGTRFFLSDPSEQYEVKIE